MRRKRETSINDELPNPVAVEKAGLSLRVQTLRTLTTSELGAVRGGDTSPLDEGGNETPGILGCGLPTTNVQTH